MPSKRYCLALDLKPNPGITEEYEEHHRNVWPQIVQSIKEAGIEVMEIYRIQNRLFMIMEANEAFSFEKKQQMDDSNPIVQEWEKLMATYQQALPGAKPGEKWLLMDKMFAL